VKIVLKGISCFSFVSVCVFYHRKNNLQP
jgi:hypothetical protein